MQRTGVDVRAWLLVLCIVVASASVGWVVGRGSAVAEVRIARDETASVVSQAANAARQEVLGTAAGGVTPAQVGRLKAEILRLRVLFRRLADAAQLNDDGGEFDIDFTIDAQTGDGEPLSELDPMDPDTLALLIERFDPMLSQTEPLARIFDVRHRAWSERLSGHPLPSGRLSSGFGRRLDPMSGRRVMHRGLDFVAPVGSPILAIADGVVTWSGPNGGYGLLVELEHAEGFKTRYAHNQTTIAKLGARVRKGEPIATLGSSGRSTGPHLHLEVRQDGRALDPRYFVR